ncbi:SDR family NAD(P)-dependent oxidoreductase [Novosphingobium sp. 9U]|uniref:SDR family NAD(P)-dependent oxidoreductase n=1 Tax=Novosphingobium sp. 9U TaxID=2653158 RepID=UPI0012EFDA2C|nr:SDR family oxidoreductase [Novosphingobium sp. 9U]VWX54501.1 putative 7-alpha-hydroxysteroid dehydrogenase [Novosphingobium sp. 9U]
MTDIQPQGAIIITGAAGGMGRPAAVRFAKRGQPLILCDISAERLDALAAELAPSGAPVSTLAGDLSAPDFPAKLLERVGDQDIAAVVHTAGLSPTMADGERVLEVNYFATERLVDALAPRMAKGACAVLISSSSGYMIPAPDMIAAVKAMVDGGGREAVAAYLQSPQAAYPISKLGVMKLVARESVRFGQRGARIVSIAPGFIDTAMSRAEAQASEMMRAMMQRVPLQRMGLGDEIASVADFLCSPAASYISGCDIKVDGGALGEMGL